jgi:hypothetical protein
LSILRQTTIARLTVISRVPRLVETLSSTGLFSHADLQPFML